ncbi:hypothetical protein PAPYR_7190 [Paratrimastix pyriformis]|uniref:Uncharacterized protein n=1 Tax=Paratrimastix pyriformis TaxID=342808 RepID=A0ABQ8UDP0_9EUKA|nr:hypothetical protein PAPYR_7190 [Paratrimastix pyriformis]
MDYATSINPAACSVLITNRRAERASIMNLVGPRSHELAFDKIAQSEAIALHACYSTQPPKAKVKVEGRVSSGISHHQLSG